MEKKLTKTQRKRKETREYTKRSKLIMRCGKEKSVTIYGRSRKENHEQYLIEVREKAIAGLSVQKEDTFQEDYQDFDYTGNFKLRN